MKSSEAIPLYIVRFMRLDDYPDEEYNYIRKSDAEKHFSMYATDNSGLYYEIQLSEVRNKTAKILNANCSSFVAHRTSYSKRIRNIGST